MKIEDLHFEGVLGSGAMATVHAVRLEPTGLSAALKIGAKATPRARQSFLTEARALATLAHSRIVSAWDLGVGAGQHPLLPEGAPYLLMERGISTLDADGFESWSQVRAALDDVLRGLGHLHGHGFVHRDIKPANILRFGDGFKVGDFGIVTDTHRPLRDGIAGTPMSMAPEQIRGQARELGPQTDLYGLGATAWRMVTGTWPFFDLQRVPVAPLVEALPPLVPRMEVPKSLHGWLENLLRRDPYSRYQSAAHALQDLPSATLAPGPARSPGRTPVTPRNLTLDLNTLEFVPAPALEGGSPHPIWRLPAECPKPQNTPLPFRAAGLWGLCPLPLVGREPHCAQIWEAAREVIDDGQLRVVILRGPHGSGRTRLAQWAIHSLHEAVGAAIVTVTEAGGPLGPTIEEGFIEAYRLHGLSGPQAEARIARLLQRGPLSDESDRMELLRMVGLRDEGPPMPEASRTRLMSLAIRQAGRVVLLLDDLSAGSPSLTDIRALLEREPATPALMLITVDEHEDLDALVSHPATTEIVLGDLPSGAFVLLASLMGSSSPDTKRSELFASRTPAMARALFAPVQEPTSLSADQAEALGLAAILGHTFSRGLWDRAAEAAGLPEHGLEAAIDSGILRPSGNSSLAFDSPLFQAAVRPQGELAIRLHRACLEAMDATQMPVAYGLHALEAGEPEKAIDPLQRALQLAKAAGVRPRVAALTSMLLSALEAVGGTDSDLAEHYVALAEHGYWAVSREEAALAVQKAIDACRGGPARLRLRAYFHGTRQPTDPENAMRLCRGWAASDPELEAELLTRESLLELLAGRIAEAEALIATIDPETLHPYAVEYYWRSVSELHWQRGRLDEAAIACRHAMAATANDPNCCPSACSLGFVLLEKGDLEGAEAQFRSVIRATLKDGRPITGSDALSGLGKVHERRGEFERAADLWVEVARMLLVRGLVFAAASIADLSLLYARVGRLDQARLAARQANQVATAHGNRVWQFVAAITLLASLEAPEQWPGALQTASELADATDFHDPDLLRALELGRVRCPAALLPKLETLVDRLSVTP